MSVHQTYTEPLLPFVSLVSSEMQTNLISLAETGAQVELLELPAVPVANSDTLFPPAKPFEALQGLGLEIGMQPEEVEMPADGGSLTLGQPLQHSFKFLRI